MIVKGQGVLLGIARDITERKQAEERNQNAFIGGRAVNGRHGNCRLGWHSHLCQRGMVQNARLQELQGASGARTLPSFTMKNR